MLLIIVNLDERRHWNDLLQLQGVGGGVVVDGGGVPEHDSRNVLGGARGVVEG
jgi:hypothetical protein